MTTKKAILIKVDGTVTDITTDKKPTLEELQKLVDGFIEVVRNITYEGKPAVMIVDEEGHCKYKPWNDTATKLYHVHHITTHPIAGDVVILIGWRF
jgi:hypothetical protein